MNKEEKIVSQWIEKLEIKYDFNDIFELYLIQKELDKNKSKKTSNQRLFELIKDMIIYNDYPLSLKERFKKFRNTNPQVRSLERYQLHYGNKLGEEKFNSYREKQAYTNTFEYKEKKYGWTREQFDEYNASRAVTLENMIKRHGKEEGTNLFNEYCNKQKYVGVTLDYFINTYGKEKGEEKYYNMLDKKLTPLLESLGKISSKQEKEVINILINNGINLKEELINSFDGVEYNEEISYQIKIISKKYQKTVSYDACIFDKKILIEYNGDLWHGNVRNKHIKKLLENNTYILCESIKEHIKKDEIKKKIANDAGFKLYVIWELDWNKNKEKIINHLKEWINNPNEYFSTEELFNESC